ncbi:MAG: glycoside hydrolase family 88 protein [Eubacteriales bacterium]
METILTILLIILAAVFFAFLLDIIPLFWRWISRIHIGQWENREKWKTAAEKLLLYQLKHTPAVPVSDNTRLTIIERLKGRYKSKNLQNWQEAALLLGANEIFKHEAIDGQLKYFINSKISPESGEWLAEHKKIDIAMLAFAVLSSPASDKQKIKPAMDNTAKMLLSLSEKSGTVPYNNSLTDVRFVDTIGIICPFLIKYGIVYQREKTILLAIRQIEEYIITGIHPDLKLPVHCFDMKSQAPLGIYGWGRGCGWFAVGLMDSYLALSPKEPGRIKSTFFEAQINEMKKYLMNQMIHLAEGLTRFQMDSGAWGRQVFINEAGESSATAMIAWFMGRMFALTGDDIYKISADSAERFLISSTRLNGLVDFAQGDTKGIGFYSARLDAMPAAQGFAVRSFR